ncbi:MAG: helix-turn-helix transcriptional regulator [Flavobacteriia bacterium]|nr:helix-turn-helix transcriptional regulator [Flavobacteriia bacterium]
MEEITNRIRQIIEEKSLTNAAFADAIDIKRPIVSHILSGRNKPSLHVVVQILDTYDDIDPAWLLQGKSQAPKEKEAPALEKEGVEEPTSTPAPLPLKPTYEEKGIPSTLLLIEGESFRVIRKES